jgi:predicted aspartyl protease
MKRAHLSLFCFGGMALVLAGMGRVNAEVQAGAASPLQKGPVSLPANVLLPTTLLVQKWRGLLVVTGSVNNSLIERVALDTGLNADVVLPDAAMRLSLSPLTTKTRLSVLNTESEAPDSTIQHLKAGSLDMENIPVALANLPLLLSALPQPDAPAVWLGTPFLSAFQITYDPITSSVLLETPQSAFRRHRDMAVVPLVMRDGRPYVKVSIPGAKPFLALVDTGSPGTLIPAEVATKLKLKPIKEVSAGKQKASLVELPKLNIGRAEWKAVRVACLTPDSAKEFDKTFAVLGMDFLSRYKVSLNYSRLQMAFTPPDKPGEGNGETPTEAN